MPKAKIGDIEIYYEEQGQGEPVLLAGRNEVARLGERVAQKLERQRASRLERERLRDRGLGLHPLAERDLRGCQGLERRHGLRVAKEGDARMPERLVRLPVGESLPALAHVKVHQTRPAVARFDACDELARHRVDRVVLEVADILPLEPGVVRFDHAPARQHDRVGSGRRHSRQERGCQQDPTHAQGRSSWSGERRGDVPCRK